MSVSNHAPSADEPSAEQLASLVLERAAIGMCLIAPDGRYLEVNPALCDLLGRSADELVGMTWRDVTHPDDLDVDTSLTNEILEGKRDTFRLRKRYVRPDGTVVWGDNSVSCVRKADGPVDRFISQVVDVSELVQSRERLQATLDSLFDAHVLFEAVRDDAGAIVDFEVADANESACLLDGHPRDELMGMRLLERYPDLRGSARWLEYVRVVDSGEPLEVNGVAYPGNPAVVASHFDVRAVRCRDGMIVSWRDVTERHEAARALAESEQHYRLLAENSSDVVLLIGPTDIIKWASPSVTEALGWRPEELVGRHTSEIVHPDYIRNTPSHLTRDGGLRVRLLRERMQDAHGVYHWVEIHARSLFEGDRYVGTVGSLRVIDAEVAAERQLAESEERFRLLAENSSDVILKLNREGVAEWVSPSLGSTLGWNPAVWTGASTLGYIHPEDRAAVLDFRSALLADPNASETIRLRMRDVDDVYHWCEARGKAYIDASGELDGLVVSIHTIDKEVAAERELERRARYDELTGMLSRREVLERIGAIASHPRRTGQQVAVLFCDVDRLKKINDEHGHAGGDALLRTVAERIRANIRESDISGRVGGDEFLVLLDGVHGLEDAVAVGEKLRAALSVPFVIGRTPVEPSVSIGVALVADGESLEGVIERADRALLEAKKIGRDQVVVAPGAEG